MERAIHEIGGTTHGYLAACVDAWVGKANDVCSYEKELDVRSLGQFANTYPKHHRG